MTVTWSLFTILSLIGYTESKCSPTSYYKNCWIRRFPGLYIDVEESQRRGAQLLNFYQEETALKCSRTCCLTRNFSCNLAVFHYNTSQETVNCFHLHCPSLESCILRQRRNAILYNVTKGVDPDLLVFGKSFTTNLLLWPHMASSRLNASEPLASDKRQFNRPPIQPPTPVPAKEQTTFPQSSAKVSTASTRHTQPTEEALNASIAPTALTNGKTQPSSSTSSQGLTSGPHKLTTPWQNTKLTSQYETPVSQNIIASLHQITPLPTQQTPASLHANPLRQHTTPPTHHATSEPPTTKSTLFTEARNPTTMAAPVNIDGGQLYPNDTKGYVSRNHTSGEVPEPGDLSPVWHLAANTLLIAAATCSAVLVGCCCSVVVVVSWRGRRRKKGRYRTSLRGKKSSMRLVKYVIVRESL
ncbi:MANSC domain-containing protein 4-like [Alosa sapidissima]|uniref:MANSC domain-containing protein 4-like n=1 Tax=Alosa sapidissima TaxID=34773 RepID=UPI001C09660B|nr:MANSC domain-containing protein 4-like [Alosa sapidissima]